MKKNKQKNQ